MSKISFEGIGEMVATFVCGENVTAGQVVKVTGDGTVGACAAGDRICGVALSAEDGYAAVQLAGLVKVAVSGGNVTAGWVSLSADGSGGMQAAAADSDDDTAAVAGDEYLVVQVETDGAVICL